MKYLLDTNICVHFLRGAYRLDEKLQTAGIENCAISEITWLELEYGVANSDPQFQKNHTLALKKFIESFEWRIIPIRDSFKEYAQQRVRLRRMNLSISDFDLLIGCTAITNNLTMVTENTKDFTRLENIILENWIVRT